MKNYNLSSTFTVLPNNNQQKINKEKYNVLNKSKNNSKQISNNKHKQYNSVIHINNLNQNKNKDNNIDNNISYQNYPNKELISSMSLNNFEDLDENLNIKLPYNNDNKIISHSMINTFGNNNSNNLKNNIRSKIITNKDKEKLNSGILSSKNEINSKEDNWYDNENYNTKLFNTFNLGNFFQFFQKKNDKSKNENRNNTIERRIILNPKKHKNFEENNLEKENILNDSNTININNNYLNKNVFKNYYNDYNATFENDHINKYNNIYLSKGPSGNYIRNLLNNKKDSLNFSKNNKKKFSVTKMDLHQFNKNEYYIKKIMESLPQNKNKNLKSNFNRDNRKHYNNENMYLKKLNNKDNNIDYYIYNNKNLYNNYLNKELSNNSLNNNSIVNNINTNHNIKTVRVSKYLSVGKPSLIKRNNNEYKYFYLKNNIFSNKRINEGQNLKDSNLIFIKNNKNYFLIFDIKKLKLFLDNNTLKNLFSINRDIFRKTRKFLYSHFYNKIIKDKNKDKYIHQILNRAKNFCSAKIKEKIKNKELKSFYNKLIKKNEIYDELILKDITRTMPNDSSFNKGKINYEKLYNILTCFSNYNKKIGYAQGLNFICAQAIYLFSSEEDIFIFLEGFINLMKMDNFFDVRNEILYKLNYFSKILDKYVPKIIKYLEEKSLGHDFFSTRWILTLFSTSMERNYLVIIWCFMIIFRWKFVYSFIIQILTRYERYILNTTEGQLCYKMKNILRTRDFKSDFNEIIKNTLVFMQNHIVL